MNFERYTLKTNSESQHMLLALIERSVSNNKSIRQNKNQGGRPQEKKQHSLLIALMCRDVLTIRLRGCTGKLFLFHYPEDLNMECKQFFLICFWQTFRVFTLFGGLIPGANAYYLPFLFKQNLFNISSQYGFVLHSLSESRNRACFRSTGNIGRVFAICASL